LLSTENTIQLAGVRGQQTALAGVRKLRFELVHFHLRVGYFLLLGVDLTFFGVDRGGTFSVSGVVGLAVIGLRIEIEFALQNIEIGFCGL
jgi:hypothetical protein